MRPESIDTHTHRVVRFLREGLGVTERGGSGIREG